MRQPKRESADCSSIEKFRWLPYVDGRFDSISTRGTETSIAANCSVQCIDCRERHGKDAREHQLRDSVAVSNRIWLIAEIRQQHANATAIVAVDRSRRVKNRNAVFQGNARARPDLQLVPRRYFDPEPGWDEDSAHRLYEKTAGPALRRQVSEYVCAGGTGCREPGERHICVAFRFSKDSHNSPHALQIQQPQGNCENAGSCSRAGGDSRSRVHRNAIAILKFFSHRFVNGPCLDGVSRIGIV